MRITVELRFFSRIVNIFLFFNFIFNQQIDNKIDVNISTMFFFNLNRR